MSILIKGMEMPESCLICGFKINCDDCEGFECFCAVLHRNIGYLHEVPSDFRLGDCPLIPVPDHGDLIDRDEYREDFMNTVYAELIDDPDWNRANRIIDAYDMAPTTLPADKEGDT